MTPREFVDALDELIYLRIIEEDAERQEIIKREMTDYLLKSSAVKGVYSDGTNKKHIS